MTIRTGERYACTVCGGHGEVADDEMSTGIRVCGACHGHGILYETPQPEPPPSDETGG